MGFWGTLDTAFLKANEAVGKIAGRYSSASSSVKATSAWSRMGGLGSTLKGSYGTSGFAIKAGASAAAGAMGGYAYDGTTDSAIKGGLLGVAGAGIHTGWTNPILRSELKAGWGDARGWASREYQKSVQAAHVRTAGRNGWNQ